VRHPVAREVENWAEKDGLGSRPSRGACHGAGGHVQRDDHRDLPYAPPGGRTRPSASGPRSLLRVGPPTHPVADEIHRHCDPGEEERCDAPGRCVTAAMSARVCEDAGRDRCGKSNAQDEDRGTTRCHRRTIRAPARTPSVEKSSQRRCTSLHAHRALEMPRNSNRHPTS
jgi:hypothetical protein